jgi:APA family basic amino acid/polyamine antiporter
VTPPRRQLGLLVTTAIVIANMIGTGVFIGTGFNAAALHDPMTIMILWGIGGVLALCGAACYAELGSMMPRAGGEYVYLREAYHPVVGFMSGWVSLTAGFSAPIATAAKAFAKYLGVIAPGFSGSTGEAIVAIALIVALTALHAFDTKLGGRVQAVFTALKVALIVTFIVAGLTIGDGSWSHFTTQAGGVAANLPTKAFAVQLMYVAFAYSGWNAAAYIAGEIEHPSKVLPRSLFAGTAIVMALYLLVNVVYFYALPSDQIAGVYEVGAKAAGSLFGSAAGKLITSVIALALVSAVSAMIMAGPRVYAAMAADRALPHQLGRYSKRGVPSTAVIVQGVLAIGFVLIAKIGQLIEFAMFALQLSAALTIGGLFILRRRGLRGAYMTIGYPLTPLLFIGLSVWIAYSQISADPKHAAMVLGILVAGAIAYAVAPKQPSLPEARVVPDE